MNKEKYINFTIGSNDAGKRLDNIIRKFLPLLPLKSVFKSIRSGDIRINGKKVKQNHRLELDDSLMIYKPLLNNRSSKQPQNANMSLNKKWIIFENSDLLLINKPAGILVHGEKNSLDKLVQNYLKGKVKESLSFSPGPLHRLDRNTSGIIAFSVSLKGARTFTNMILENQIDKRYLTIVDGIHKNFEIWDDKIDRNEKELKSYASNDGKSAKTTFTPLFYKKNKTVALLRIITGRTHQIRIHSSIHDRPLTGDKKYNNNTEFNEYYLSAISLTFLQKSDIVNNISNFILPLKLSDNNLLTNLLSDSEIKKVENLILKELYKNESIENI